MTWLSVIQPPAAPAWHGAATVHRLLNAKPRVQAKPKAVRPARWVPWALLTPATDLPAAFRAAAGCWRVRKV